MFHYNPLFRIVIDIFLAAKKKTPNKTDFDRSVALISTTTVQEQKSSAHKFIVQANADGRKEKKLHNNSIKCGAFVGAVRAYENLLFCNM